MNLGPYSKSRRLTRCITINGTGEQRPRFIEAENFHLWRYLVANKHGMRVLEEVPCLWVSTEQFSSNSVIYEHAGEIEPVNRIVIDVFDSEMGHTTTIERFAHRSEVFKLLKILNDHLADIQVDEECIESAIVPGYAVERRPLLFNQADFELAPGLLLSPDPI